MKRSPHVVMRRSGATFSPSDISSLIYWWRSDLGITTETGVSSWVDQVGGVDFVQATTTRQPALTAASLNGHATVDFDGTDDALAGTLAVVAQPITMWLVLKEWTDVSSSDYQFVGEDGTTNFYLRQAADGLYRMAAATAQTGPSIVSEPTSVFYEFNGSSSNFRVNGSVTAAGGSIGTNGLTATSAVLGAFRANGSASTPFSVAEWGIFSAIPSAAEYASLDAYANHRYAI